MYADYYWLKDSLLLHVVFLLGTYLCFREFWPLCRAAGHQTFSLWGTLSGCALVVVHYWSLQIWIQQNPSMNPDPLIQFQYLNKTNNLLNGAMVIAVLGAFLLTGFRHQYPASLGGLGVT